MAAGIGELCKLKGETTSILSVANKMDEFDNVKFSFAFGGKQFHEMFCISDQFQMGYVEDLPIIGVLGNIFMQKHELVIDHSDFTFHTSHVDHSNLCIADCEYFFPMEPGLKFYGIPAVFMKLNGKDVVSIADTGATNNLISIKTIDDCGVDCEYLGSTDSVSGVSGKLETKDGIMPFNVVSLAENSTKEFARKDLFKVADSYFAMPEDGFHDEDGNELSPIEAILGAPFIAKEGWILDFGAKIIYKRRA